jgi:hypothetical protein
MGRHHDTAELAERLTAILGATPGASAASLADALGLARSTTAKALAALQSAGRLVREQGGREGSLRLPDRWYVAAPADAVAERSGSTTAVHTSAPPARAGLARTGQASVGHAITADAADPAGAVPADAVPAETDGAEVERATDGGGCADDGVAAKAERLRRGALGELVLEVLGAHGDGALGPVGVAKVLGRSSGAVSNALVRLVASGEAEEVGTSPRRYRATST